MLRVIHNLIFKCNLDVTMFVFAMTQIFPVLAESRAGGGAGAPHAHAWLTETYIVTHPPAPILQTVQVAVLTLPVHGAATLLLLSEAVVTHVP